MGQIHFEVPSSAQSLFDQTRWSEAYICGIEGIPWQCQVKYQAPRLTLSRAIHSSGKLHLVCPVGDLGPRTLSTCSLRESQEPYSLFVELARGCCYRAQNQADIWRRAGLTLDKQFDQLVRQGVQRFLDSVRDRDRKGSPPEAALEAIEFFERAIDRLGDSYTTQSIAFRKRQEPRIGTMVAASVLPPGPTSETSRDAFKQTFNAAMVRLNWGDIENDHGRYDFDAARQSIDWCIENGLRVVGGPLIDFRTRLMPHWLYVLEDNFETLLTAIIQFAEQTVKELKGKVHLWNCASGLNTQGPIRLDDEQAMRIAVGILQTVRRLDPGTPAIMSFDQPFGEYLSRERNGISPLHFADALARSGLGMAGLGLDLRYHYRDDHTDPRSVVDFSLMIDRWSTLGLPLMVHMGVPGGSGIDPNATAPSDTNLPAASGTDGGTQQSEIAVPLLKALLAKHCVHAIVWDGWSDAEPHVNSHSGLLDVGGKPRPLLSFLQQLRQDYLC